LVFRGDLWHVAMGRISSRAARSAGMVWRSVDDHRLRQPRVCDSSIGLVSAIAIRFCPGAQTAQ